MLGSDRTLLRLQPWSSHPGRSVEHFGVGFDLSADGMNVMTQLCRCVARHVILPSALRLFLQKNGRRLRLPVKVCEPETWVEDVATVAFLYMRKRM